MKLTATDLVKAIDQLPKGRAYYYVNPKTRTQLSIDAVTLPEGPITIQRSNPTKGLSRRSAPLQTISTPMIWRVANALLEDRPINLDRVLGGSYNTRSALEALLAHTPEFHVCYPGRVEVASSSSKIKRGHKHLVWKPNQLHEQGKISLLPTENMAVSEVPSTEVVYDALVLPDPPHQVDIEIQRKHAYIQVALAIIGEQLGYRVWIAQNDRAIRYKDKTLAELPGVIPALRDERLLSSYAEAAEAATFIDCVWFRNTRFMPAVMEIEQTTGIISGLDRMLRFRNALPPIQTRWVIVAPDEDRPKVLEAANRSQFREMRTLYFPYSAVMELCSLCQRRDLRGVSDEFLDCFLVPCVN